MRFYVSSVKPLIYPFTAIPFTHPEPIHAININSDTNKKGQFDEVSI